MSPLEPCSHSERIHVIDALRGVAVLGILIMNIQSFTMIDAAYLNPAAYGDLDGANGWAWRLSHIFADQKFMSIFSMLFGASVLLIVGKAQVTGKSGLGLHYSRTFWLLVLGLAHAYLLWHGDILVTYAICALFIVFFRNRKPLTLVIVGLLFVMVPSLLYYYFGITIPYWDEAMVKEFKPMWLPPPEIVQDQLAIFRGSWEGQLPHRMGTAVVMQTFVFLIWLGWRAAGMMLIGMALFKWGVVTGTQSKRFYTGLFVLGFALALPLILFGVHQNEAADFSFEYSMYLGWQFNYWGSLFMALGYIGLAMLIFKALGQGAVTRTFAAVGRTAFSNYLGQSVICTFLFYGQGFGLYGHVERRQQILITVAIWVVLVIASNVWLKFFRFGPAEWLWRSLTYFRLQPLLKK